MSLPSNHVLHNYDILNMLVYKTLLGKEKKGEEDGMNLKDNIGRNARPIGVLACPPHLTSY